MTHYVATMNTPGYRPTVEPLAFGTASEAWAYLAKERMLDETEDNTYRDLTALAARGDTGTLYGPLSGREGLRYLGLAYSVSIAED